MAGAQSDARSKPQQERSIRAVNSILDAADELFGTQGYQETQMAQIIERSGVRAGSLYRFFADKRAIGIAIIDRHYETMDHLKTILPPAKTLEETLVLADAVVEVVVNHQHDNPGYTAVSAQLNGRDPESTLYKIRQLQIDVLVGLVSDIADHLTIAERRRIVQYGAEIVDALTKMGPYDGEPAEDHVAEIKRVIRAYLTVALTPS